MSMSELLEYYAGDDFAAHVWKSKYAKPEEQTPDDMHRRMAREFARIRTGKDSSRCEEEWLAHFYGLFKDFSNVLPQGRVMAGLGTTENYRSLSNCLRLPPPKDSYSSIMYVDTMLVSSAKRGCGYGVGLSNLRPELAATTNAANSSSGVIAFGNRYSNSTHEVGQQGRRGACLLDLDIRHPSAPLWSVAKKDERIMTGANISFKVWGSFIKAVQENQDYILRWPVDMTVDVSAETLNYGELTPYNNGYVKRIKAVELWNSAIHGVWSDGCPGLQFWEKITDYDPASVYERYVIDGTNACMTGDTPILTSKGYFPIESVIGEEIEVWNGKTWSKVTPTITGLNQDILNITLSDGRLIKCTPYHNWYIDGKGKTKAIDLRIGDKIEKYKLPITEYGTDTPGNQAYTQGFYSGDGNTGSPIIWLYNEKISLAQHLEGKFTSSEYPTGSGGKRSQFKLSFNPRPKTWVPVNDYSITSRLNWLSGLIDSDGSCTREGGLQIWSVDKKFLEDVQLLLSTLGVNSRISEGKAAQFKDMANGKGGQNNYFCQPSHRLSVGAYSVQELISLGLNTHRVNFSRFKPNRDASHFVYVKEIKQGNKADMVYCFTEPHEHKGIFNGVLLGQCGEQPMAAFDTCRLIAENLFGVVTNPFKGGEVDFEKLYQNSYEQLLLGDDLVDLECIYIQRIIDKIIQDPEPEEEKAIELSLWEKVLDMARSGRRVGCGITGLADMLAAVGLKYDSEEALELTEKVMATKMQAELDATIDLAERYGPFKGWDPALEYILDKEGSPVAGRNEFYEFLLDTYPEQVERMCKVGRRNVNWSTIAPVGTLSIITKAIKYPNISSGCEPQFALYFFRNKKVSDGEAFDFKDEVGIKWKTYPIMMGAFKDWIEITKGVPAENFTKDQIEELYKISPWYGSTSAEIDWKKRIDMQAILQKYTTSAISSTINLPNSVKEETISELYLYAFEKGLKGITCYRDGSKGGVLVTEKKTTTSFEYKDAPKRPKELPGELNIVTVKGAKYGVVVGLMEGKPYELFAFPLPADLKIECSGKIVKLKRGAYSFKCEDGTLHHMENAGSHEQQMLTRLVSGMLRHGAKPTFVQEQIEKCELEIVSFGKAIGRVLKRYVSDEDLVGRNKCKECNSTNLRVQESCLVCMDCGSSKCG
jgi:ribonucleotide reductase alpha subunit